MFTIAVDCAISGCPSSVGLRNSSRKNYRSDSGCSEHQQPHQYC